MAEYQEHREHFVTIRARGEITIPADIRRKLDLDRPGTQLQWNLRDDGVIELVPHIAVPKDQEWFWSPEWQAMEREADASIAAGRIEVFDSVEEVRDWLLADD